MSKFNKKNEVQHVENLAGGQAFALDKKTEFATLLLTHFCENQFYRTSEETLNRIRQLITELDPIFVAKSAIYARDQFNMRSVSHVVAAELAKNSRGVDNLRRFFNAIVVRPDDMTEIASLASISTRKNGKARLPKALKEGFKQAFNKFDSYQLAKYRMEGKGWSLVDLVNMVRPVPTDTNAEALRLLVEDKLRCTDTWESKLTAAGSDKEEKNQAWKDLLTENKLGYMALLRNLRNILQQAPGCMDLLCTRIQNEVAIQRSRVLPFRFFTAYRELQEVNGSSKVLKALSKACDIALTNIPNMTDTVIVLDSSGSMTDPVAKGKIQCVQAGALFAASLVKANDSDFVMFDTEARYLNLDTSLSVLPMAEKIVSYSKCGGTDFDCIFKTLNKAYKRIIILSDMQGWVGYHTPEQAFSTYKRKFNCSPSVYSIDLRGNGTSEFNPTSISTLSGFSEKLFDLIVMAESDKQALVHAIEAIEF